METGLGLMDELALYFRVDWQPSTEQPALWISPTRVLLEGLAKEVSVTHLKYGARLVLPKANRSESALQWDPSVMCSSITV